MHLLSNSNVYDLSNIQILLNTKSKKSNLTPVEALHKLFTSSNLNEIDSYDSYKQFFKFIVSNRYIKFSINASSSKLSFFEVVLSKNECNNDREYLGSVLDVSPNVVEDVIYCKNTTNNYSLFGRIIKSGNMGIIQLILQKLFKYCQNNDNIKLHELLQINVRLNHKLDCLGMLKWHNEKMYRFVNDIYNASKNEDLLKLRSLLDVISPNQERAQQQVETLTKQHLFSNLFIKQLG